MASETEIERLVVRLTGDNSQYQRMLDSTLEDTVRDMRLLEESFNEVAASGRLLEEASGATESLTLAASLYSKAIADLVEQEQAGIDVEEEFTLVNQEFAESLARMNNLLVEAKQAQEAENAAQADAEALRRSLLTVQDLHAEGLARIQQHLLDGRISQEEYNAALEKLNSILPETIAAKKAAAEEQARQNQLDREATAIVDRHRTAQEKYDAEATKLSSLLVTGRISQSEYDAELERLSQILPDVIAKNKERIEQEKFLIDLEKTHAQTLAKLRREDEAYIDAEVKAAQIKAGEALKAGKRTSTASDLISGQVQSFAAPLIAAAGVHQVISAAKQDLREIDQLATQAQRIGIDIRDKQLLDFAAKQSSVEIASLDRGLKKYNLTQLDAVAGSEKAQKGFKALNLDAKELSQLPLPEQIKRIAEGMEGVTGAAERQRIATQLFGKDGANLVTLLSQGGEQLDKLFEKREQLGPIISKEDAQAVKDANDAMERATMSMDLMFKKRIAELAPLIEQLANFSTTDVGKGLIFGGETQSGVQFNPGGGTTGVDLLGTARNVWSDMAKVQEEILNETRGKDLGERLAIGLEKGIKQGLAPIGLSDWYEEQIKVAKEFGEKVGASYSESMVQGLNWKDTWDKLWGDIFADPPEAKIPSEFIMEGYSEEEVAKRRESIEELTKSLEDQVATQGMSAESLAIYRATQNDATGADIARIRALYNLIDAHKIAEQGEKERAAEAKKAAEEEKHRVKSIEDYIAKLEETVATHGMTTAQLAEYELKQLKATDADIARAKALAEQKDAQKEAEKAEKEYQKELEKAQREKEKLMEEGRKVMEKLATPSEKLKLEEENLKKLFKAGALSVEEYDKAASALEKELAEKELELSLKMKVEGLDVVRAGTKEFFDLQRESKATLDADSAYGKKLKELKEARPVANLDEQRAAAILKPGVSTDEAVSWLSKIAGSLDKLVLKEPVEVEEVTL